MRVLAHVHKYPPEHNAGAEWMLKALLEDLVSRGHTATVYGAHLKADHHVNGVDVRRKSSPRTLAGLYANADLVVTHLDETKAAIANARRHGLPVVHLVHNHRQLSANKVGPATADLVVANSEWIKATFPAWANSLVVYPPVNPADYETTPGSMVTLLNLAPAKGGRLFFDLARALPEVPFLGVKGAYALQAIPKDVPANVELVANTPRVVEEVYSRTAILLVPSSYESYGRVAIEAASSGIPVLAHPTEGLTEALGDAGVFLDRDQPEEWRREILELLEDDERRAELGGRLKERAAELEELNRGQRDAFVKALEGLVADQGPAGEVDFVAGATGYFDHLAPVWLELPEDRRGRFYVTHWVKERALAAGIPEGDLEVFDHQRKRLPKGGLVVAASSQDAMRALERRTVLLEHGAGQSYSNRHQSYAGGTGRKNVVLHICPGRHPAKRNARYYPNVPVVEVGCPKLDAWLDGTLEVELDDPPLAVISFHWRGTTVAESGTVLDHYKAHLGRVRDELADAGVTLAGHAHGAILGELKPIYEELGVEVITDFAEVLRRASVYIVDNSSTLFEFAATGRPVVVLNGPPYRKDAHHGRRFWTEADVGVNVEGPLDLAKGVLRALEDPDELKRSREEAVSRVYSVLDGSSSRRAAMAILDASTYKAGGRAKARYGTKVKRGKKRTGPTALYPNPSGRGMLRLTEDHARELGLLSDGVEPEDQAEETPSEPSHKKRPEPKPGGKRRRRRKTEEKPEESSEAAEEATESPEEPPEAPEEPVAAEESPSEAEESSEDEG